MKTKDNLFRPQFLTPVRKAAHLVAGILLFTVCLSVNSPAQSLIPDVIASAGDSFTGNTGSLSWTLGETAIETLSSETILLTQGFQQSHFQIVRVDAPEDPTVDISVYPNPVSNLLTIEITSSENSPCIRMELVDIAGQRLYDRAIHSQTFHEQLDVSRFGSSLFILRVTNLNTRMTESFKINKIKH